MLLGYNSAELSRQHSAVYSIGINQRISPDFEGGSLHYLHITENKIMLI